jgi:hypothetical protein
MREVDLAAQINLSLIGFLWNFQLTPLTTKIMSLFKESWSLRKTWTTPLTTKIMNLFKESWSLRISDFARFETSYVPTRGLSWNETQETSFTDKSTIIATVIHVSYNKECWNSKADPDHQHEPKMKTDKRNETWQNSRSSSKQTKELWLSIINTNENNWYMNESYLRPGTKIGQKHEDGIPSLQSNKGENIHLP